MMNVGFIVSRFLPDAVRIGDLSITPTGSDVIGYGIVIQNYTPNGVVPLVHVVPRHPIVVESELDLPTTPQVLEMLVDIARQIIHFGDCRRSVSSCKTKNGSVWFIVHHDDELQLSQFIC